MAGFTITKLASHFKLSNRIKPPSRRKWDLRNGFFPSTQTFFPAFLACRWYLQLFFNGGFFLNSLLITTVIAAAIQQSNHFYPLFTHERKNEAMKRTLRSRVLALETTSSSFRKEAKNARRWLSNRRSGSSCVSCRLVFGCFVAGKQNYCFGPKSGVMRANFPPLGKKPASCSPVLKK